MKRAFTLIEMLIYMGIMSAFIVVLTNIFVSVLDVQLQSQAVSSVEQDGRFILSRLSHDIRRAQSITTPASAGSSAQSLVLVIGGSTYTYSDSSGSLTLNSPLGLGSLTSFDTTVSGFTVTRIGNTSGKHSLQINFTLTSVTVSNADRPEIKSFQTTVGLR